MAQSILEVSHSGHHAAPSLSERRSKGTGQDSRPESHRYLWRWLLMALGMWRTVCVMPLLTACQEGLGESSGCDLPCPLGGGAGTAVQGASGVSRT